MKKIKNDSKFKDALILNGLTEKDYLDRLKKIAISLFEWENLPESMNARYLEETLFYKGQASFLKDEEYGFINTQCCSNGQINIYGLPTSLNCFSFTYSKNRFLYTGLPTEEKQEKECILVMNNYDRIPTCETIQLFAKRLAEAERTIDVNIKAQKTPILIKCSDKQKLVLENLYKQYDGNKPVIIGDKDGLELDNISSINTKAEFISDKLMDYKKEIWNEALAFLGINTLSLEKRERMITEEANSNNELINLNLQSYLIPRKEACKQFNELFGLTGTEKEINVKVRSDLYNIIKLNESIISKYGDDDNE